MRRTSCLLLLLLFPVFDILNNTTFFSPIHEEPKADDTSENWADIQEFDQDFKRRLEISGCPGAAVAIVKDDQILFLQGYGTNRSGTTDSVDAETIFRIGSLSKGFAGLLTGRLVEEGCLNWEDKVQEIITDFSLLNQEQAGRINIQHLLSHSTGLPRHAYTNLTESGLSIEKIIPSFARLNVSGKEGVHYAYQNTAFSMIEKIIQEKTGKDYIKLLHEKIFLPAQMERVSTNFQTISQEKNVALPHTWNSKNRCIPLQLNTKYYNAVSAGGINASIRDMAAWLNILLGNRPDIISEQSLDFIFSPLVKNPDQRSFSDWGGVESNYYGIGWRVVNWPDRSLIYHGGSVNGYRSEIAFDRKSKVGICVLFNCNDRYADQVIPDFFKRYFFRVDQPENNQQLMVESELAASKSRS